MGCGATNEANVSVGAAAPKPAQPAPVAADKPAPEQKNADIGVTDEVSKKAVATMGAFTDEEVIHFFTHPEENMLKGGLTSQLMARMGGRCGLPFCTS